MTPGLDFSGKTAIVTGSTRGIGLATATLLAELGAKVVITSRKAAACDEIAARLVQRGHTAVAVPAHAASETDLARLVANSIDQLGTIDVVIGNAAINPSFEALTDLPEQSWAKIIDTNLSGALRLARSALPLLADTQGTMVLVSSVNASFGMAGSGAYGISKAAIEQMVRQLAVEWGPRGVRVNAVSPGTTETDMVRELIKHPGFIDHIRGSTPLGRIGQPDDIANVAAFLASDLARHVTGQCLVVDGGQSITRGAVARSDSPP
jgi:dehydrogenase/reductase SDR family member 4